MGSTAPLPVGAPTTTPSTPEQPSQETSFDNKITVTLNQGAPEECLDYIRRRTGGVFEQNVALHAAGVLHQTATALLNINQPIEERKNRVSALALAFGETEKTPTRNGKSKRYSDARCCIQLAQHPEVRVWAKQAIVLPSIEAAVEHLKSKL